MVRKIDTSDFGIEHLRQLLAKYKSEPEYEDGRASIEIIDRIILDKNGEPTPNKNRRSVVKKVITVNLLLGARLDRLQYRNIEKSWAVNARDAILTISSFDKRLKEKDIGLVSDIRRHYEELSGKDCPCFASKYAHSHNHDYPISDSKVKAVIYYVTRNNRLTKRTWNDLDCYGNYVDAFEEVVRHFKLRSVFKDGRDLDKALWMYSKNI